VTDTHVEEPAGVPDWSSPGGLVRLRLDVAYDGAAFHGWARQPGLRSVQAELEGALRAVLRVPIQVPVRVAAAGRTDAGVHATGQVCHADVPLTAWAAQGRARGGDRQPGVAPSDAPEQGTGPAVRRRLNGVLARDLRMRGVTVAPAGFDARWSASWRRYEYLVADTPSAQDPRTRGHVLWHPRPLDVAAMDRAARPFAGEHDFAAFCRARPDASTVRTVHELSWRRSAPGEPGGDGPAVFAIRADAFCHSMVRSLVGAFLAVGDRRWPVERPEQLLRAGQRVPAIATAAPHGLTLVEVGYPPPADLAGQARRARRWRGPARGRV
jgi:tRNA pseudouridine38-40 synthase